jgi:PAS domain-containing protein
MVCQDDYNPTRHPALTPPDLSDDAQILYSSDSIVDILGHTPDEVVNRSVWQFFHPDELPLAREQHNRGVRLDKAAVLSYCRLKNRQGDWVGCECCFSVVYDVLVCCTSVYRHGMQSQSKSLTRFDSCGILTLANQNAQSRLP